MYERVNDHFFPASHCKVGHISRMLANWSLVNNYHTLLYSDPKGTSLVYPAIFVYKIA